MYISEAIALLQTIKSLQTTAIARQVKFGYMLAHNRRLLEAVEEGYNSALNTPDDAADTELLTRFEEARVAALEAVAKKDAQGNPVIENNAYVIDNMAKKLPQIEAKLVAAYPEATQIIQKRTKRMKDLGNETQEIPLRKIALADWPDLPDTIPAEMINGLLLYLVQDDQ